MDKKIIGLLGAAAALSTFTNANATQVESTTPVPAANFRDLLNPVPNALEALKADDARLAKAKATEVAQISIQLGHHHHHHHHHHVVPRIIRVVPRGHHHHHHHHHHHSGYYQGR